MSSSCLNWLSDLGDDMQNTTPLKAIRLKCLDCCCGSSYEVSQCPATGCPLHKYRDGHNPSRKGTGRRDAFKNFRCRNDKTIDEDILKADNPTQPPSCDEKEASE